jgi:diguanylate cyclase (GGDEF)-like protein
MVSPIPAWAMELHAVAVAALDESGLVVESNQGFLDVVAEPGASGTGVRLTKPGMAELRQPVAGTDGRVYAGPVIFADSQDGKCALTGNIYRAGAGWLVAAEMSVSAYRQLNSTIERLGRELEEAERTLTRRNQAVQTALAAVEALKRQDAVTGLANRKSLNDRIGEEISRWERYHRPLGLMLMEMDDLRGVNETYGREVGDELLRHVATIITRSLRATDLAVRYGDMEFAVLLPETNEIGALIVAERLRMELENQIILPMVRPLTASFGVAMLLQGEGRQELFARAERATAHSRMSGRNCVTMAGVIGECDQLYQAAHEGSHRNV